MYKRQLELCELRGNLGTRLRRLDDGDFDAILLACAGLRRLDLGDRIAEALPAADFLPAPGQGVIGIQRRADDDRAREWLMPLHHADTAVRLAAERALSKRLGGACHVPVAGHARVLGDRLHLEALVASPDGRRVIRDRCEAPTIEAQAAGIALAERLLDAGAREVLAELGIEA